MKTRVFSLLLPLLPLVCAACGTPPAAAPTGSPGAPPGANPASLVQAQDRSEHDRALDAGRHPAELLAFLDLKPGMSVAEIGAGPGYTTELLARAVGPTGKVYMQNEPTWLPFLETDLRERFTHPAMSGGNVVREEHPFEDPIPDAKDLDAVVINLIYHDVVNTKTDRAKMNRRLFDALKPGGAYVVIDASAPAGSGVSATDSLHRIDEQVVRDEVTKAGFVLAGEGSFLRNPDDKRDWNAAPKAAERAGKRGTSDRFVLRFERPRG